MSRTLQCCGLLFKIIGEEFVHNKCLQIWNELRRAYIGKLTEVYQTVHMRELTDFPENDQEDPTEVLADFHFWGRSVAHEAYHLSHGSCQ